MESLSSREMFDELFSKVSFSEENNTCIKKRKKNDNCTLLTITGFGYFYLVRNS